MEIDLDFDGVEPAVPFQALDPGEYSFNIDSAEIKEPTSEYNDKGEKRYPQLMLILIHTETGSKVWHFINLGDASTKFLVQFLLSIYTKADMPKGLKLSTQEEKAEWCAQLTGMPLRAVVTKVARKEKDGSIVAGKFNNSVDSFSEKLF